MGQVWLTLDSGTLQLPLGLLGTASIAVSEPNEAVTVPAVSVRSAGGDRVEVVVCDGSVARVRDVQTGRREDGWVEVTSGLTSGERVAIDEVTGLEDGATVDVAPETP
jgi:HlyD family secretion protein